MFRWHILRNRDEVKERDKFEYQNDEFKITSAKFWKVPSKDKNDTSPVPGRINLELLKYSSKSIVRKILCDRILVRDPIPQELKVGYLIPIFKKGNFVSITEKYVLQVQ